jgi:tetratricopeptide (TPR) repeat protein
MKSQLIAALLPAFAFTVSAPAQNAQAPFQTPALLIEEDGAFKKVWLVAATKNSIRYRETEVAVDTVDGKTADFSAIYLFEPREFALAMDLFQARKYAEAKEKFIAIKERYKPLMAMENSHAALAAFYEMECLRKLGDLEGLSAALQKFIKDPLTRETHLRQIELYVLWDALRTKSWDRLDILAKERAATRLPGDQRAQVAYLHGLALEGLDRPEDALFAYSTAMTADAGASEEIARQATLRVLAIHKANPEVQNAIKVWGTSDENKNSKGYSDLLEAAGVAELFELSLGSGTPLPAEYKTFLKYKAKAEG